MKKKFCLALPLLLILFAANAQKLQTFSTIIQYDGKSYLSIKNKKTYTKEGADSVKAAIDFALVATFENNSQTLEWYNMSGRDSKVPASLTGSTTMINGISFDRDQFDKCVTTADLTRMTGHITPNSFSHFASISHSDVFNYHCFIVQLGNGKRALLYITVINPNEFKLDVKAQE
jgi:hypothetical protein